MDAITKQESTRLDTLETIIENGINDWIRVGNALAEVRDNQLYRAEHETFADYCRNRWNLGKSRAYQLIAAAELSQMSTTGGHSLKHERQARELGKTPKEHRQEVMDRAFDRSDDPSSRDIAEAREEVMAPKKVANEAATPKQPKSGSEKCGPEIRKSLLEMFGKFVRSLQTAGLYERMRQHLDTIAKELKGK